MFNGLGGLILRGTESCLGRAAVVGHSPCVPSTHRDGGQQSNSDCLRARLGIKSSISDFKRKILKLRNWKAVSYQEIVLLMNCIAEVDRSSWPNLTGLLFSAGHVQGNFRPCLLEVAPASLSPLGELLSLGHKVSISHSFTLKKMSK